MEMSNNHSIISDTSGLVSLATKTDQNHSPAVEEAAKLEKAKRPVIVPTDVLTETLNILGKKSGQKIALQAASQLLSESSQFVLIDTSVHIPAALTKFKSQPSAVSFTDCIVMAVADHYHTIDIFGFDKQFADAGYTRLTPSTDWGGK